MAQGLLLSRSIILELAVLSFRDNVRVFRMSIPNAWAPPTLSCIHMYLSVRFDITF